MRTLDMMGEMGLTKKCFVAVVVCTEEWTLVGMRPDMLVEAHWAVESLRAAIIRAFVCFASGGAVVRGEWC